MKCQFHRLRHRVTIQAVARNLDGQGGYDEFWTSESTVPAEVTPLKNWERMQAMQANSYRTHKVLIRYRPAFTSAKRLVYRGRVYDIKEVIDLEERRQWLQIVCAEADRIDALLPVEEGETPWSGDDVPLTGASQPVETIDTPVENINRPIETIA